LAAQLFEFTALPIELGLIGIDLPLLVALSVLLALELVADQRAATEAKRATDRRAGAGMTDRPADDAARRGTAESADARAFLARGELAAGATRQRSRQQNRHNCRRRVFHKRPPCFKDGKILAEAF
jgi:hypothetical protein